MRFWRYVSAFIVLWTLGCAGGSWKNWYGGKGLGASSEWDTSTKISKFEDYRRRFGEISLAQPVVVSDPQLFSMDFETDAKTLFASAGAVQTRGKFGKFSVDSFSGAIKFQAPTTPESTSLNPLAVPFAVASAGTENVPEMLSQAMELLKPTEGAPTPEQIEAAIALVTSATKISSAGLGALAPLAEPIKHPARTPIEGPGLPENPAAKRMAELDTAADVLGAIDNTGMAFRPITKADEAANAFSHITLLEFFSNPTKYGAAAGVQPVVIAGYVTVSPGEVTEKGFIAEISLRLRPQSPLLPGGLAPTAVVSLFPSTVGQNMDMQSLFAAQKDIAVALEGAGYAIAGKALLAASRLSQSNVRSLNQRILLSSFNRGQTNEFGWRIRGEYWSIDPSRGDSKYSGSKDGSVLLMQDIVLPVVFVAMFDKEDWSATMESYRIPLDELKKAAVGLGKAMLGKSSSKGSARTVLDKFDQLATAFHELEKYKTWIETEAKIELSKEVTSSYGRLQTWFQAIEVQASELRKQQLSGTPDEELSDAGKSPLHAMRDAYKNDLKAIADLQQAVKKSVNAVAPRLVLDASTSWLPDPSQHGNVPTELQPLEGLYRAEVAERLQGEMDTEEERAAWLKLHQPGLEDKFGWLKEQNAPGNQTDSSKHYAENWISMMEGAWIGPAIGKYRLFLDVPVESPPAPPIISHFYPPTIPEDKPSTLLVIGSDFGDQPEFLVAGSRATSVKTFKDGKVALVEIDPRVHPFIGLEECKPSSKCGDLRVVTNRGGSANAATQIFVKK